MRPLLLIALASIATQDPAPWRLVYQVYGEGAVRLTYSVREDGQDPQVESPPQSDTPQVYSTREKGVSEIWVADADGRNKKRLTQSKSVEYQPRWTADRKRIVFVSGRTGDWQLWIMGADGSHQTQLTRHAAGARDPVISPARNLVAYREFLPDSKPGNCTLRFMDLAGNETKALVENDKFENYEWSPKGDRLACGVHDEVRVLEIPSGKLLKRFEVKAIHKDLTNHTAWGMVWRPDGAAIACRFVARGKSAEETLDDNQLFILPLEGSPVVIEAGGRAWPVGWIK